MTPQMTEAEMRAAFQAKLREPRSQRRVRAVLEQEGEPGPRYEALLNELFDAAMQPFDAGSIYARWNSGGGEPSGGGQGEPDAEPGEQQQASAPAAAEQAADLDGLAKNAYRRFNGQSPAAA